MAEPEPETPGLFSGLTSGLFSACEAGQGDGDAPDGGGAASRRREFCHFGWHPLSTAIETPAEGRGEVQQNDSLADG